jgi:hypothetical protein
MSFAPLAVRERILTVKASMGMILQFSVALASALGLGLRLIAISRTP